MLPSGNIRVAEDLVTIAKQCAHLFGVVPHFRRHGDTSWSQLPSIYRPPIPQTVEGRTHLSERSLTNDFIRLAYARSTSLPSRADTPRWLCLMRHHGLPTRLLDWSRSVFVAAYFAVASPGEDALIWVIDGSRLNMASSGRRENLSLFGKPVQDLVDAPFRDTKSEPRTVLAISPAGDLRMLAQHSEFTLHG